VHRNYSWLMLLCINTVFDASILPGAAFHTTSPASSIPSHDFSRLGTGPVLSCDICFYSLWKIMNQQRQTHTGRRLCWTGRKSRLISWTLLVRRTTWLSGITTSEVEKASSVCFPLLSPRVYRAPETLGLNCRYVSCFCSLYVIVPGYEKTQ